MDRHALRRWLPLAAILMLLAAATVATARSAPDFGSVVAEEGEPLAPATREPEQRIEEGPSPVPSADRGRDLALPGWLGGFVQSLCVALAAVLAGAAGWYGWRRRPRRAIELDDDDESGPRTTEDVVAALDAGLVELSDTDLDPRRAVIACWVRLERAAAAAGTPRHPGDTPTDLVTRLLRGHRVSADVLAGFAEVYREARYAEHTVDEAMRTQARSALRRLRSELAGADLTPVGDGS